MRFALPCVGLDALGAGLLEIDWKAFEVVYAYDIDASLTEINNYPGKFRCFGFICEHGGGHCSPFPGAKLLLRLASDIG